MNITTSKRFLVLPGAALAVLAATGSSQASMTLTDGNSSIGLDPASPSGVYSWIVDGQEQLYRQWFWTRVGGVGSGSREWSIDTISTPAVSLSGLNSATVTYNGLLEGVYAAQVKVKYTLAGGTAGSGLAALNEEISIVNNSASPLNLQFFQYSDFDLGGTASGDSVLLFPENSPFQLAYQWDGTIGLSEGLVSINPAAGLGAVDFAPSIYNQLQDGARTDLNTSVSPIGPGDVEFSFQWDLQIAPGGSIIISKIKDLDINVIPEPTIASLMLLGMGAVLCRRGNRA